MKSIGIETIGDLIQYFPIRYADYSRLSPIGLVQEGEKLTVQGTVTKATNRYVRRNFSLQEIFISDDTGEMKLVWFNQPYIIRNIGKTGTQISVSGTVEAQGKKMIIKPDEYEIVPSSKFHVPNSPTSPAKVGVLRGAGMLQIPSTQSNSTEILGIQALSDPHAGKFETNRHTGRIVPVYSQRGGLSSRLIRDKIADILQLTKIEGVDDWLPDKVVSFNHLTPLQKAIEVAHNPKNLDEAQKARLRFAFDDLFTLHLSNTLVRREWHKQKVAESFIITKEFENNIATFMASLPFTLTSSQQKAWVDIRSDLLKPHPMNRFLQGDVGSGKTVVAALGAYLCYLNGYRTLFMCPTEILAQQHYDTLSKLFEKIGLSVDLITGSAKTKPQTIKTKHLAPSTKHQAQNIKQSDVIIGTHALLSDKHTFDNVGLVIIDEQHRFGVAQRAILKKKTTSAMEGSPHLLTMTATPIPRTLALTLFGDLDLTVLSDMPAGRLPIKTYLAPYTNRQSAYTWIEKQIKDTGCQVFIVCPRITDDDDVEGEESKLSIKAVETETEYLQKEIFPTLKIGSLHGKMKSKDKEQVMQKFKDRQFDILVTTTVVEVGIDIPNAKIIVIEGAERYGLAQLHQLRGRVGRSNMQSYCVLFTTDEGNQSNTISIPKERLTFFTKTTNGMELAEYDFRHRGPGNLYGTAQHGAGELEIGNLFDYALVSATQKAATAIAVDYSAEKYPLIAKRLAQYANQPIAKD